MLRFTFVIILLLKIVVVFAQFPDNTWLLGYGGGYEDQDSFGLTILDFTNNQLSISEELEIDFDFSFNNTAFSNEEGELLFYFNGLEIWNKNHELMANGDNMYQGDLSTGYNVGQAAVVFPLPDHPSQYFILHTEAEFVDGIGIAGENLFYSIVDMSANSGAGEVIVKRSFLLTGFLEVGNLTATRHANGRDWWVLWKYFDSNVFVRFLLTPDGIEQYPDQAVEEIVRTGLGQAVFSPDGTKYISIDAISPSDGDFISIFSFDRCFGLLDNRVDIFFYQNGTSAGASISRNSRFLYINTSFVISQYDLWADDIESSKDTVAIYDGYRDPWLPTTFFMGQLARDGRIYVSASNSVKKLTVIDEPDKKGLACNVRQHAIELPVRNAFGIPTFPNHRLGPIDGSPCDTLGIDNIPLSNFRSDQDTSDYLSFYFQDLSAYEPTDWQWSFGDGAMSQDTSPVHQYIADGVYEVCLTVSNENGSHTSCDTLNLGIVNTSGSMVLDLQPQVFPNPFKDQFSFVLNDYYPRHGELRIFDGLGRKLHQQRIFQGWNTVDGREWGSGVYFWEFWDGGVLLGQGKVVKASARL